MPAVAAASAANGEGFSQAMAAMYTSEGRLRDRPRVDSAGGLALSRAAVAAATECVDREV
jgi:hypothetical protein